MIRHVGTPELKHDRLVNDYGGWHVGIPGLDMSSLSLMVVSRCGLLAWLACCMVIVLSSVVTPSIRAC